MSQMRLIFTHELELAEILRTVGLAKLLKKTGENINLHLNILSITCLCIVFMYKVPSVALSLPKLVSHGMIGKSKHDFFF